MPDPIPWSSHCIRCYGQNPGRNEPPQPWDVATFRDHVMIPLHRPLLKCHKLFRSVLITPDQVLWASSCHIRRCSQNHGWNKSPCPRGCESHPRSHGQHVTIAQPHTTCATLSVSHLAGGPGT